MGKRLAGRKSRELGLGPGCLLWLSNSRLIGLFLMGKVLRMTPVPGPLKIRQEHILSVDYSMKQCQKH